VALADDEELVALAQTKVVANLFGNNDLPSGRKLCSGVRGHQPSNLTNKSNTKPAPIKLLAPSIRKASPRQFLRPPEGGRPRPEPADLLGNIVSGVFTPVLAKHTKNLSLVDILAVGVDRMQRNFDPMRKQVEAWKGTRLPDEAAKLVIYRAFVEGELDVPKHLARRVHDLYFYPQIEEFAPRTTWSLSNAFTSAFKELDPIPQFKATAKLGAFLAGGHAA